MKIIDICDKICQSRIFEGLILAVIVFAGILVGVETYSQLVAQYRSLFHFLDQLILWIFVLEMAIKIIAEGRYPLRYFQDPWNVFDFTIVVLCFLPIHVEFVAVLRLVRILRVLRLIRAIPKLRLLVGALLKSIPSIGYVSILLVLLFYLYAVLGTFLYGKNDPLHFGELPVSMLTLFRVVTLEDWTDVMYTQMYGCQQYGYDGIEHLCTMSSASPLGSVIYFVSFVLFGTMITLNLFIGIIMNSMSEMQEEAELKERMQNQSQEVTSIPKEELVMLMEQFAKMQKQMQYLRTLIEQQRQ